MEMVVEILLAPFVACLILTGVHTYLGLHVVSRGVIFVDLALAQIAALGATFAFLLGYAPRGTPSYLYSLLFAFIGAAIFSVSHFKDKRVPQEAFIGISFAVASAATILLADRAPEGSEFVQAMLTGALLWVSWATILKTAVIYALIGLFHWTFRKRFLMLSLDPQGAAAAGWSVRWWDFLFYMSFGFVITSSVAIAGVLLVFSFLVIPSVIAMLFATNIRARLMIGWMVGTVVSVVGLSLSYQFDFPSGPAVVVTFGAALVLAATGRYLMHAEHLDRAFLRVAAAVAVVAGGLWLAIDTAANHTEALPEALLARASSDTPADRVNNVLAALRAAPERPPADLSDVLTDPETHLHSLLITRQVVIAEDDVALLAAAVPREHFHEIFEELAHHSPDLWVRLRAAEKSLEVDGAVAADALVELLASDAPMLVKLQAAAALEQASGVDFGFDPLASAEDQQRAIEQWRRWIETVGGGSGA